MDMIYNKKLLTSCLVIAILVFADILFSQNQNTLSPDGNTKNEDQYNFYFQKADSHLGKYEFEESIKDCQSALKYRPNDFLMRAMMCLDYYEIAERLDVKKSDDKDKKIEIYKTMIHIAEEGIACAPDKGECYFMRGLANARMATTKGVLSQLFTAKQIETDWLVAVNRRSDYVTPNGENLQASSCLALGVYYRLCPTFFLLKWIFGISGDLDKAVAYCHKAYYLDSTRIEIVKEFGVALITRGLDSKNEEEIEQGKEYLRKVAFLPLRLQTDKIDIEHSKLLLGNISLCPGYSRDEEQDVSKETFAKENSSSN
jgi:tetratricopeptide (TPR) repeat protein